MILIFFRLSLTEFRLPISPSKPAAINVHDGAVEVIGVV